MNRKKLKSLSIKIHLAIWIAIGIFAVLGVALLNVLFLKIVIALFFLLAAYEILTAFYFEETAGAYGMYVGKKNNYYMYWSVIRFVAFTFVGCDLYLRLEKKNDTNLIFITLCALVILLGIVYFYNKVVLNRSTP